MNDRKPIVLSEVKLNHGRTIGHVHWRPIKEGAPGYSAEYTKHHRDDSEQWVPLCDLNFVELWQKSESTEHFVESYSHNHPEGRGFTGANGARKRYDNLGVVLKELEPDSRITKRLDQMTELAQMRLLAATLGVSHC